MYVGPLLKLTYPVNTIASRRSSQLVFEGTQETGIIFVLFPYITLIEASIRKHLLTFFGLRFGSY